MVVHCNYPNCMSTVQSNKGYPVPRQAKFGYENEKPTRCRQHMAVGMVDVAHGRCSVPGCIRRSSLNDPYDTTAKWCIKHIDASLFPSFEISTKSAKSQPKPRAKKAAKQPPKRKQNASHKAKQDKPAKPQQWELEDLANQLVGLGKRKVDSADLDDDDEEAEVAERPTRIRSAGGQFEQTYVDELLMPIPPTSLPNQQSVARMNLASLDILNRSASSQQPAREPAPQKAEPLASLSSFASLADTGLKTTDAPPAPPLRKSDRSTRGRPMLTATDSSGASTASDDRFPVDSLVVVKPIGVSDLYGAAKIVSRKGSGYLVKFCVGSNRLVVDADRLEPYMQLSSETDEEVAKGVSI